jgi:amino-acid N-acetyltransferase
MIRRAKISDAKEIQDLNNFYADKGEMLPRGIGDIYENIRDFYILELEGKVKGCCSLHICWDDIAEIKALAVAQDQQGKGWGKKMVDMCLKEAKELQLKKVFCLTYKPAFFEKMGFKKTYKSRLPQKVWVECVKCHKFPDCDETCLIYDLENHTA